MQRRDFLAAGAAALTGCASGPQGAGPGRQGALSSHDGAVRPLLEAMTLDEKLGQMTQGETSAIRDESEVERLALGSLLAGGDADPPEGNSLAAWTSMVDRLIARSQRSRLGIPILFGVDAVHGHNNVEGAVIFPHNVGLGCTRNAELVQEVARVTALETRATGIHWTFAPCIAVPQDVRWGRSYEGFAEDPNLCGELGAAVIRGLQTADLGAADAVLACAKHFVGDGGTRFRPRNPNVPPGAGADGALLDQGDTVVDEATLRRVHMAPYLPAIAAGTGTVMVSYSSWNGRKLTGHEQLVTGVLKQELGFEGIVVSDYNAILQVDRDWKTAIMMSINAGIDLAMEPTRYAAFIGNLKALVQEGRVPMSRIDDAVTRMLRVKAAMGLLDKGRSQLADRRLHAQFGSAAHRHVARRAVRESVVLLKNQGGVLPLARNARRLIVAGRGADDLGMQCGGWTISWQGRMGAVTQGTTLLAALRAGAPVASAVTYAADGTGAAGADAAIVVVGETPYAEYNGDRAELTLSSEDQALVARVTDTGVPTVLVVYSGRPLVLGPAFERCAAVLAAWLPGTEGTGLADVLLGRHAPRGRLGFGWPQSMSQVPRGAAPPQFPYGYGLSFG